MDHKINTAKINVSPEPSMCDEKVTVVAQGLPPSTAVTIHSNIKNEKGQSFECIAHYISNNKGTINLNEDRSTGGSYIGVEPMGLFWAMDPSPDNTKRYAYIMKRDASYPSICNVHIYDIVIKSLDELSIMKRKNILHQHELVSTQITRLYIAEGVKKVSYTLKEHGISASLFIPPGRGPFPGVISMRGGYPGIVEDQAALLASHGFVGLALAQFGSENFTHFNVNGYGIEYLEKAVEVLCHNSFVNSKCGVGLICFSMSTNLGLAMAEFMDKVKCVVWINGVVHSTYYPLTYHDRVVKPHVPLDKDKSKFNDKGLALFRYAHPYIKDSFHPSVYESLMKFYLKPKTAFLFIASLDDECSPSDINVNKAEGLLKAAKHPNYQILRFPGAGHLLLSPYNPMTRELFQSSYNLPMIYGGQKIPHCRAQEQAWIRLVKFLKENLAVEESKL